MTGMLIAMDLGQKKNNFEYTKIERNIPGGEKILAQYLRDEIYFELGAIPRHRFLFRDFDPEMEASIAS